MTKAIALKPSEINKVLKKIKLMPDSETKSAAMVLSHAGMRVSEIARVEPKDLLYPSGKIREEVFLPGKICKGLKPRTIWITNPKTRKILQEYVDYRIKKKWGLSLDSEDYQGLMPELPFIFNNRGRPYVLADKKRKMIDGSIKVYKACDALEDQFRKIYQKCGLFGASSHSGRKSLATNSAENGVDLDSIARVLGHDDPEMTLHYIQINEPMIEKAYEVAI